jgi:hypothetical protein
MRRLAAGLRRRQAAPTGAVGPIARRSASRPKSAMPASTTAPASNMAPQWGQNWPGATRSNARPNRIWRTARPATVRTQIGQQISVVPASATSVSCRLFTRSSLLQHRQGLDEALFTLAHAGRSPGAGPGAAAGCRPAASGLKPVPRSRRSGIRAPAARLLLGTGPARPRRRPARGVRMLPTKTPALRASPRDVAAFSSPLRPQCKRRDPGDGLVCTTELPAAAGPFTVSITSGVRCARAPSARANRRQTVRRL